MEINKDESNIVNPYAYILHKTLYIDVYSAHFSLKLAITKF